jgi:hypothetical protein
VKQNLKLISVLRVVEVITCVITTQTMQKLITGAEAFLLQGDVIPSVDISVGINDGNLTSDFAYRLSHFR